MRSIGRIILAVFLIGGIFYFVTGLALLSSAPKKGRPPVSTGPRLMKISPDEAEACLFAHKFIKEKESAKTRIEFPPCYDPQLNQETLGYKFQATNSQKTSFVFETPADIAYLSGETVHREYTVSLAYDGHGGWQRLNVEFKKDEYSNNLICAKAEMLYREHLQDPPHRLLNQFDCAEKSVSRNETAQGMFLLSCRANVLIKDDAGLESKGEVVLWLKHYEPNDLWKIDKVLGKEAFK